MTETNDSLSEAVFPHFTRWVNGYGTVELGYDPATDSFVRAIDEGGVAWKGESPYANLSDAFQHLEKGIGAILSDQAANQRRSTKTDIDHQSSKTRRSLTKRRRTSTRPSLLVQVQKLEEIGEAIRRNETVQVTRLTVVRELCENSKEAGAFAIFLAEKARGRLHGKQGNDRYVQLADRAIREMKSYLVDPNDDVKQRLWSVFCEIQAEQNEYMSQEWSQVGKIADWDLLIVETTLRATLRPDAAQQCLYYSARDYVGGYGEFEKEAIPKIKEIAQFWRKHFTDKT